MTRENAGRSNASWNSREKEPDVRSNGVRHHGEPSHLQESKSISSGLLDSSPLSKVRAFWNNLSPPNRALTPAGCFDPVSVLEAQSVFFHFSLSTVEQGIAELRNRCLPYRSDYSVKLSRVEPTKRVGCSCDFISS